MKIIGYKCQYCKKNFQTNDRAHERECKKSSKKLKFFKQLFIIFKSKIVKIVYNQLKVSESIIDLFEAVELLEAQIIKHGYIDAHYDLHMEQNYFQNEAISIINALIEEHLNKYILKFMYPEDFGKEYCIDLIRESILRKFKKIYPNINVW